MGEDGITGFGGSKTQRKMGKVHIAIKIFFPKGITREYHLSDELVRRVCNGEILHIQTRHPDYSEMCCLHTIKGE